MLWRNLLASCLFVMPVLATNLAAETSPDDASQQRAQKLAAARPEFDWSQWKRLPVLDEGRVQPLDTLSEKLVTLVTGRPEWTDPATGVEYASHELLYAWITAPEAWLDKPVIRCEYRPLRRLLNTDDVDLPVEGAYVSLRDVLDWEESHGVGKPVFWSKELEERLQAIDKASRQGQSPSSVGETADDQALNGKVGELFEHLQTFLAAREARNIDVVPGLDPRVLTEQRNPDKKHPAWVSLGAILRMEQWQREGDPTIAALMADSRQQLLRFLLSRRLYPAENLPQLAQAQELKDELLVDLRAIQPALQATRKAYDQGDAEAFASAMQTFHRMVRRLGEAMNQARREMTPPDRAAINFGQVPGQNINQQLRKLYEPLKLDERQMAFSAYPAAGSTDLEVFYNELKPFAWAWVFFLVALVIVLISTMVKAQRAVYFAGLLAGAGAIAFSAWGFGLRIAIAGRPPVTDMYETVIWVSFVVAVLGFWFGLIPLIWPGLSWAWKLTGLPLRLQWSEAGRVTGVEIDEPTAAEQNKMFAAAHLPVRMAISAVRLAAFVFMVWFLTDSGTSYAVSSLAPPMTKTGAIAPNALLTWIIGLATVLLGSWYLPRAILTLLGGVITCWPEAYKQNAGAISADLVGRRFFIAPALAVACFGMMLAHFVGIRNPDILDPRIGSIAAVLRNNYWLTIHVLTIVSSYGAGALAWGLGNLAMLYYLFGRYRTQGDSGELDSSNGLAAETAEPSGPAAADAETASSPAFHLEGETGGLSEVLLDGMKNLWAWLKGVPGQLKRAILVLSPRSISRTLKAGFSDVGSGDEHLNATQVRPPQEVSTLATYSYKTMQVAVLLLAAGTILGGLWADVSWGRFWDWDPKEVWALISLLVYLAVLHGRFAGWFGTFGTNAGSVLCFTAIVMSWYGVNFILPEIHGWLTGTGESTSVGLHSYAGGKSTGLWYVLGGVALNWLLVFYAMARYASETMTGGEPPSRAT